MARLVWPYMTQISNHSNADISYPAVDDSLARCPVDPVTGGARGKANPADGNLVTSLSSPDIRAITEQREAKKTASRGP